MTKLLIAVSILILGCSLKESKAIKTLDSELSIAEKEFEVPVPMQASVFNFPVGPPDGKGYYNAQKFGKNNHLGDDWNSNAGGNNDLGDPISSIANGYVTTAEDFGGGWGNVIRITHYLPDGSTVESLYAHCDTIFVQANSWVEIGDKIGTIGTNHGHYYAHLHVEIRNLLNMPIGGGYNTDTEGYLDPTEFINKHR